MCSVEGEEELGLVIMYNMCLDERLDFHKVCPLKYTKTPNFEWMK